MRLLLIEDDLLLGDGLAGLLRAEGHVVDWCTRLSQTLALVTEPYDAWLIDWQLPDGSGVDWLRERRSQGFKTPTLVLTARDRLSDRIEGLDSGADDYLIKPFAPEELLARLRAQTRRAADLHREWIHDTTCIDLDAKSATVAGQSVELTAREWAVLEALLRRAGRLVSASDLEALVHGLEGEVNSNALQVHISKLRAKLGREVIETVRGLGYRMPKGD